MLFARSLSGSAFLASTVIVIFPVDSTDGDSEADLNQTLLILSKVILGCPLHGSVWEEGVGDEEERPGHGGHTFQMNNHAR